VAFVLEEGYARLRRVGSVAARTAGMLASPQPALGSQGEKTAAEQAWAEEAEVGRP
jgi:hypothetical protein